LQIIQGALHDKETTVEDVEMLWVNVEKVCFLETFFFSFESSHCERSHLQRDFVCEQQMASIESRFKDKLFVTKVLKEDLFDSDVQLQEDDTILGGISAYEPGRIVVLAGTISMIDKFSSFLSVVGYPDESILSIEAD
jgi:hypothetical protein